MDEICIGFNPRGRGISFGAYSSILSGWLTAARPRCGARMHMRDHCKGDKRNCDDGQDNDGGQCEAKCGCVHLPTPFFVLCFFSF